MKKFIFFALISLVSCTEKEKKVTTVPLEQPKPEIIVTPEIKDSILQKWSAYYEQSNPNFNTDLFKLTQTSPITFNKTSVKILNKKRFNEIYKPFLVFSKSGEQYLDFDSYQWSIGPDGAASFEADQQVALVDLRSKTAKQIAFFGPSYWVEEAYWKGDSVAVLLGNSYEKVPFKSEYNFKNNTLKYFQYPDTLQFDKPYSQVRLEKKGIRVD